MWSQNASYRRVDYLRQDSDRIEVQGGHSPVMKLKKQVYIYSHTHIHPYRYRHKEGICEGTTNFKLTRTKNIYRVYQQIRYLGKVGDTESIWESQEEDSL